MSRRLMLHHVRRALLATLVLLALGAGATPEHASATTGAGGTYDDHTITTVLYPGWNLVGWVGPDTPTSELFEAIPALWQVWAWDAESQAYVHGKHDSYDDLPSLSRGMGLWLRIGGGSAVEWSRKVGPDAFAVRLHTGSNLVAIAADGGVTSVSRVATAAYRWNSEAQRFAAYRFGDAELRRGDALWLEVGAAVNWWQTGTSDHAVLFLGDVPVDAREAILGQYERVKDFFVERFGIVTPGPLQYIAPDDEPLRGVYVPEVRHFTFASTGGGLCTERSSSGVTKRVLACTYPNTSSRRFGHGFSLVPEFAQNLHFQLPSEMASASHLPALPTPHWLAAGATLYAETAYVEASEPSDRSWRADSRVHARRVAAALSDLETVEAPAGWIPLSRDETRLAFFAVERLLGIAGEPALFEYFRQLRHAADWRDTFARVFGIAIEDFYPAFEAHRAEAFPPLPHLVDDLREPVLVILDGVPTERGEAIREEFATIRRFFANRFEVEATEFTIFVAPDAEAIQTELISPYVPTSCWVRVYQGAVSIPLDLCTNAPEGLADTHQGLEDMYYDAIRGELSAYVPSSVPNWFVLGVPQYVRAAYADHAGRASYIDHRNWAVSVAEWFRADLLETGVTGVARGGLFWYPVAFLAAEWLADHAGDPALFDFFQRLPETNYRWEEAFEGAFGLTIEEFYEQFEAYRATLTAE